jgi:mono/diheme cytochrome c family protein
MKFLKTSAVILFTAIFFIACGGAPETTNTTAKPANSSSGTPTATANANQPAGEMKPTSASFDAKAFYTEKCALCHNDDGKGNAQMKMKDMPDFTNAAWQAKEKDEEFAKIIKEGKKPMPAFDKLTDDQVKALVAHVRAFAKK